MTLIQILVFASFGLGSIILLPGSWRRWGWFIASLVALYWLQPSTPIRNLDFWFPSVSILLTILCWATTQKSEPLTKRSWQGLLLASASIAAVGLTRYLEPLCCLTPTRPPPFWQIGLFLGIGLTLTMLIQREAIRRSWLLDSLSLLLIIFFILLKSPVLGQAVSEALRSQTGQPLGLASAFDLRWLGAAYYTRCPRRPIASHGVR